MDIYTNPVTANMILSLENDSELTNKLEEFAGQIAPSFYKLSYTNAAQNEQVVSFSYASFLSYSFKEMYDVRVSDVIGCALRKLDLDPIPFEDSQLVIASMKEYYFNEIKLGTIYTTDSDQQILNEVYTQKKPKSHVAKAHGITVYKLNKILSKWSVKAYERLSLVKGGIAYSTVMEAAQNATAPHLTLYQMKLKKPD